MSQTHEGGLKTAATNKAKYGEDYYETIGSIGGRAKNPLKGFGSDRARARAAGKLGGQRSKRVAK